MIWLGILIDFAILVGLAWAFIRGSHDGLIHVVFDSVALVVAVVLGLATYHGISLWLVRHLHLSPIFGPLASFAIIGIVLAGLYILGLHWLMPYHPHRRRPSNAAQAVAAVLSAGKYLVVVAFAVILAVGLPLPGEIKTAIDHSHISSAILDSTNQLQSSVDRFLKQNLTSTFNFLTTSPKADTESIALGFRTGGHERPDLEQRMLKLINDERTSRGLRPLKDNPAAQKVALAHSLDMFARGYFAHVTPEGVDPFQRMQSGGVNFSEAGENLALAPTLGLAHNGLMNSPEHKANILEPAYHSVGIGIIDGGKYGLMVTQDFTN